MKKNIKKLLGRTERGQAIILITFAFVGLVAMVGLVTDTGITLIEYGKLKRSVDAASIAAAQEYRPNGGTTLDLDRLENAAISILQLNQVQNINNVQIHTCEPSDPDRPALCNPDPDHNPLLNRKLVEITASSNVTLGFLRVIGINSVTLTASSLGEAATIDLVLIMDTSASMAYATGNEDNSQKTYLSSDSDDDPYACNIANNCQPMRVVKDTAWDFVSRLYFPYDRVSVIAMTSQTPGGDRGSSLTMELIPLTSSRTTVQNTINNIKVFEPRLCRIDNSYGNGDCLLYSGNPTDPNNRTFQRQYCEKYFKMADNPDIDVRADADPSSCPSSNIAGALKAAAVALQGSGDVNRRRVNSFWVVVGLFGGAANATDAEGVYANGFCPQNTWLWSFGQVPVPCRDPYPSTRHYRTDDPVTYTNPINGEELEISLYDADDAARDEADILANSISGNGVTIYTIGLGSQIKNPATYCDPAFAVPLVDSIDARCEKKEIPLDVEDPPAESLLRYIAEDAGGAGVAHGQYFYATNSTALSGIFEKIAQNIATKISQ